MNTQKRTNKPTKVCPECDTAISRCNFSRHISVCTNTKKRTPTTSCIYCYKEFSSKKGAASHATRCIHNPNKLSWQTGPQKGSVTPWNKGLTSSSDARVAKGTAARKLSRNEGKWVPHKTPHTPETKQKISNARKSYLLANPDKVPYVLNHYSRGESYPERYFREILEKEDINFEAEYRVGLYSLDFLIGTIDLEIDGEQHYQDPRIADSDVRREAYLASLGYTTIRVRWSEYTSLSLDDRKEYIQELLTIIKGRVD